MKINTLFFKCDCGFWNHFEEEETETKCWICCNTIWKREIKDIPGGKAIYVFKENK